MQRRRRFWLRLPARLLAAVFYGTLASGIAVGLYEHSVWWGFGAALGFVIVCMCAGPLLIVIATRRTVLRWLVPRLISRWARSRYRDH
jgi:hypothetical protein